MNLFSRISFFTICVSFIAVLIGCGGNATRTDPPTGNPGQLAPGWMWQNPLPTGINLLDIHFLNSTTGYVCGEHGTVLSTSDGGTTWQNRSTSNVTLYAINFSSQQDGWITGDQNFVAHTVDGGLNWTIESFDSTSNSSIRDVSFGPDGTVYTMPRDGGLLYTSNSGTNWLTRPSPGVIAQKFSFLGYSVAMGCADGVIARSTNTGSTWANDTLPFRASVRDIEYLTDGSIVAVVGSEGSEAYVKPSGGNWAYRQLNMPAIPSGVSFVERRGWTVGDNYISYSPDGGNTWTTQSPPPNTSSLKCVDAVTEQVVYAAGHYGMIIRTTNSGTTWDSVSRGSRYNLADIFFLDASNGWACGASGTILHTTDGGAHWSYQTTGTGYSMNAVCFAGASRGWIASYGGRVYRTTNGGSNWIETMVGTISYSDVFFVDQNNGWLVGESGTCYKSTDGGITWNQQTIPTTNSLNNIHFSSASNGVAGGYGGVVVSTTNGGNTWQTARAGNSQWPSVQDVISVSANEFWAAIYTTELLHTTDSGVHWDNVAPIESGGTFTLVTRLITTTPGTLYLADYTGMLYTTRNNGVTWSSEYNGLGATIRGLAVKSDIIWECGEAGMILRKN